VSDDFFLLVLWLACLLGLLALGGVIGDLWENRK
jgi:hypothetical protein